MLGMKYQEERNVTEKYKKEYVDELFDYKYGVESCEKLKQICETVGTDWVNLTVFDGVHEFCKFDEPIEKLIADICGNN